MITISFLKSSEKFNPTIFFSVDFNPEILNKLSGLVLHHSPNKDSVYINKEEYNFGNILNQFNNFGKYYIYHVFNSDKVEEDFPNIFHDIKVAEKYSKMKNIYCVSTIARNVLDGKFCNFVFNSSD